MSLDAHVQNSFPQRVKSLRLRDVSSDCWMMPSTLWSTRADGRVHTLVGIASISPLTNGVYM